MRETTLSPGDLLFKKDEYDHKLYYLTSGYIEYFMINNDKIYSYGNVKVFFIKK